MRIHKGLFPRSHHDNSLRVDGLCDHITVVSDVFNHFVETSSLHFLILEVAEWVANKVEEDATLTQLLDKELLTIHDGGIWNTARLSSPSGHKDFTTLTLSFTFEW